MTAGRSHNETIIELGEIDIIRHGDEWRFFCGCGDIVDFEDVQHVHCPNCWITCNWCCATTIEGGVA